MRKFALPLFFGLTLVGLTGCSQRTLSLGEKTSGLTTTCTVNAENVPLSDLVSEIGSKMGANVQLGQGVDGSQTVTVSISESVEGFKPEGWIAVLKTLAKTQDLQFQMNSDGSGYSLIKP